MLRSGKYEILIFINKLLFGLYKIIAKTLYEYESDLQNVK